MLGDILDSGGCYYQVGYFSVQTGAPNTTALQVVSVSPAPGATNVSLDTPVSVNFNEAINAGTANGHNVILWDGQGYAPGQAATRCPTMAKRSLSIAVR